MARASLAGRASIEGTARTGGYDKAIMNGSQNSHPAVKRAIIFWFIAVGALFVFHVGGAELG